VHLVLQLAHAARSRQERLGGYAPSVHARAADVMTLHNRCLETLQNDNRARHKISRGEARAIFA
jgi:hypothetical protein